MLFLTYCFNSLYHLILISIFIFMYLLSTALADIWMIMIVLVFYYWYITIFTITSLDIFSFLLSLVILYYLLHYLLFLLFQVLLVWSLCEISFSVIICPYLFALLTIRYFFISKVNFLSFSRFMTHIFGIYNHLMVSIFFWAYVISLIIKVSCNIYITFWEPPFGKR